MKIKTFEGLARLTDTEVIFEYGPGALPEKKYRRRRVVEFVRILDLDYEAPFLRKAGLVRIITREGQVRVHRNIDTYAMILSGSRRQSRAFVRELKRRVAGVEYQAPPASGEPDQVDREVTREETALEIQGALQFGKVGKFLLMGDTLSKGRKTWPVADCSAVFESLSGAQDDRTKARLIIETKDETHVTDIRAGHETEARKFAARINFAAEEHRKYPVGAM
jgi:hypothetical protein